MDRIRTSFRLARVWTETLDEQLQKRVRVVCGDIARPNLGLDADAWEVLASRTQAVCHNAAMVDYVRNYQVLRPHNVQGTRELLRFCFAGTKKEFHLVSSTFIFGWTAKETLWEADNNQEMANLDFGYSQSKWVAEQLALAAEKQGIKIRIYRPSLISASTAGVGSSDDIAIRLLAFMINNGVAVNARNQISFLPADVTADNIVAIFKQRATTARTFHVTADCAYNMIDITRLLTSEYGYRFTYHDIPDFVAKMNRLCTKSDPLYPLLDFFNWSHPRISAMQHKRYDNSAYREARRQAGAIHGDPPLSKTLSYVMAYMTRERLIKPPNARERECTTHPGSP
jgi:thioester reductase-like protein